MQDPLFQFTEDATLDLSSLFNADQGNQADSGNVSSPNSINETTPSPDAQSQTDNILETTEAVPQSTLEQRIKEVEDFYKENPVFVNGTIQKRLERIAQSIPDNTDKEKIKQIISLLVD